MANALPDHNSSCSIFIFPVRDKYVLYAPLHDLSVLLNAAAAQHVKIALEQPGSEPATPELRDVISFDEYLVNRPETSFLLSVTGDSMSGAGIMEKDLVIVERNREPKNGDIILAEVDGNWTMKYFRKEGKTVTLEAANPKYPPIIPKEELRIAGVITAVVRKYHK